MLSWPYRPSVSSALESLLITIRPGAKPMILAQKFESQKVREETFLGAGVGGWGGKFSHQKILINSVRLMWAEGGHVSIPHTINIKTASR